VNALEMAQTAYASATTQIRTPRATEYEIFGKITRRIRDASRGGRESFRALASALHDNRRFWTILALDIAGQDNGLPPELRARLFYLNEFTQQHTSKVLSGRASADILVEINTAVMRGLRGEGKNT